MHIRRVLTLLGLVCGSGLFAASVPDHNAVSKLLATVPLTFERNAGQLADQSAGWVGRGNGYAMALGATGATIAPSAAGRSDHVRMQFLNARPHADSKPLEPLPGTINYLIGRDPKRWIQNLPTYGRIEYQNVYDGIDVAWYGNQGQVEYDFLVHPGADANRIRMNVQGARKLALSPDGSVDIATAAGTMQLRPPRIYQDVDGARRRVEGGYVLESANGIAFQLARYDRTRQLVIDPILVYGSYLASGFSPAAIATDAKGNVYIAGTASAGVPTVSALQPGDLVANNGDCFVMKLDPATNTVLYATYIGGSTAYSQMQGIAVDASGELVGTGTTGASDFPLYRAADSTFDAADNQSAFLLKLNASGTKFIYSTYMTSVVGVGVALDASSDAYVVGDTYAAGVATAGVWQTSYGGGFNDVFVAKYKPGGQLQYFTFLGGSGYDIGAAIAVDGSGDAYVAGYTNSTSFPGNPPGQYTTNAGGYDAFVAEVSPDASKVTWLTFLGGSGNETTTALARDTTNGTLYVAGWTTSADLPTTTGQLSAKGPEQGFIASLSSAGTRGFVTYLGGSKEDIINAMTLTGTGLVVAGISTSSDLPVRYPIQPTFVGNGVSLFKSANSGGSWTAADTGLPEAVAITDDPSNANTLLALSISPFDVFRTTNGGSSWTAAPLGTIWWYSLSLQLIRSPANPSVVYVSLPFGGGPPPNDFVYRSTDGGVTWTNLPNPPISSTDLLEGVALSGTHANTLVEIFYSGAVYRSTDGGTTFTNISSLSTWPCVTAWAGPVATGSDGSFYIGTYDGICKSTDTGSTWAPLAGSSGIGYATAIVVSPSTPTTLYAIGSGTMFASTDGGTTWSPGTSPGGTVSLLAVAPSNPMVVYAAGSGGVFVSTDGAGTWSPASSLPFPVTALAVNPSSATKVYAGGFPATNGFVAELATNGTLNWSTFYSGSNGAYPAAVTPTPPHGRYVWMAGSTASTDLPITATPYSNLGSTTGGSFLAEISNATPGSIAACPAPVLNPASLFSYGAGTLTFSVTAASGCPWNAAASDKSWITVPLSGTASGVVSVTLAANNTGNTRNGSIGIDGQSIWITQADSSCSYSLQNLSPALTSAGGTQTIQVTTGAGCPWNVVLPTSFISLASGSSSSGMGTGTVTLTFPANYSVASLNPAVQVGPQSITITEPGTP